MKYAKALGYFAVVFLVGSIPIIGPFLAWNLGCNFGKELAVFHLTGQRGDANL